MGRESRLLYPLCLCSPSLNDDIKLKGQRHTLCSPFLPQRHARSLLPGQFFSPALLICQKVNPTFHIESLGSLTIRSHTTFPSLFSRMHLQMISCFFQKRLEISGKLFFSSPSLEFSFLCHFSIQLRHIHPSNCRSNITSLCTLSLTSQTKQTTSYCISCKHTGHIAATNAIRCSQCGSLPRNLL